MPHELDYRRPESPKAPAAVLLWLATFCAVTAGVCLCINLILMNAAGGEPENFYASPLLFGPQALCGLGAIVLAPLGSWARRKHLGDNGAVSRRAVFSALVGGLSFVTSCAFTRIW